MYQVVLGVLGVAVAAANLAFWWYAVRRGDLRFRSWVERRFDVVIGTVQFDEVARTIIDGRTAGFCKLVADRATKRIVGCHVVGDRAADIVQAVAIAMQGGLTVDGLARQAFAFPTYLGILGRAAYRTARTLGSTGIAERTLREVL